MSKRAFKENFLVRLELFYRNYGSDWTLSDFSISKSQMSYMRDFLIKLEEKGILKINPDGESFKVIDLPSNHKDLFD